MPNTKSSGGIKQPRDRISDIYHNYNPMAFENYNDEGSAMRYFYCAKASKKDRDEGLSSFEEKTSGELTHRKEGSAGISAYTVNRTPRKNIHPTVKPTDLMQYLIRLVSPKGATILDPFMGSGSTGKAVMYENAERNADYKFIGVEMTAEYLPICLARIKAANKTDHEDIFTVAINEIEEQICMEI